AEALPVGLAPRRALDAGRPVRVLVVRVLDLEADRAREPRAPEIAEDRPDVELSLAERREVEHALAAALVLQVDVADPVEPEPDVLLGPRADVVDDVAGVVVDADPVASDLVQHPDAAL